MIDVMHTNIIKHEYILSKIESAIKTNVRRTNVLITYVKGFRLKLKHFDLCLQVTLVRFFRRDAHFPVCFYASSIHFLPLKKQKGTTTLTLKPGFIQHFIHEDKSVPSHKYDSCFPVD